MVQKSFLPVVPVAGAALLLKNKKPPASEPEKFVFTSEDDEQLRKELSSIAGEFACTNNAQREWVAYFNNPTNIQGIKEALNKYGLPPRNRKSYRKNIFKWVDFCDWGDTYRFYYYANIAQDYPALNPENKKNCYVIQGYIAGLEQEKVSVTNQYAITNDKERYIREMEVIGEKLNDFNSLYATMQCDAYKAEEDRLIAEAERTKALEQSQKINVGTYQQTAGASGGGTKIALYAFGGVALLIGIMVLARKRAA